MPNREPPRPDLRHSPLPSSGEDERASQPNLWTALGHGRMPRGMTPPDEMNAILAGMKPEETRDALKFVDVCRRFGSMDDAEYDERCRRILARQDFMRLDNATPAD